MKKYSLKVTKRDVVGKKVKKLRKEGILPGNIYGRDVVSTAVQVPFKEFENLYNEAGETGLVELELENQKRPVLIHNVQLDYITQQPVHADFFQVNLKEKVKTMVQIVLTGEPKAVSDKLGLLLQTLNEVEVEALPTDLPENITVDVTHLAAVNDQVTIGDIKAPSGVTFLTDQGQVIAKISELVSKEAEAQAAAEAAAQAEAKAEGTEGEAPTAEAKPTEAAEKTPEAPKTEEKK